MHLEQICVMCPFVVSISRNNIGKMAVMRLIMIIRAVIMINPKKVEEYFRWSKNRISSADEITN